MKVGKKYSFYENLFLCVYPIWMPHFPPVNVSKHAFFAVNLTTYFKLFVGFRVNFVLHRMYLVFCFVFLSKNFNTVGPLFFDQFSLVSFGLFFNDFSACIISLPPRPIRLWRKM